MGAGFVAGATGYTGREVVRRLIECGARAVAHVRPDSPRLEEWTARFTALGASVDRTPWDAAALRDTLTRLGPDVVFGLLGTTRARGRQVGRTGPLETYETVDYGLSALLLQATVAAAPGAKFVYLSSIGVREGSGNQYLLARWRFEQELKASGLRFVIARPSLITGPDRDENRPAERVAAAVGDAVLAVAGALGAARLRQRYRSTTSSILAGALVDLGLDPAVVNLTVESEDLRPVRR